MSKVCPLGQNSDAERTVFGSCMDAVRTLDPTRPDPTRDPDRPAVGEGLSNSQCSSPNPFPVQREVWHHLTAGLALLSLNDHGRPWPNPRRDRIAAALADYPADLCIRAARDTREIVAVQDRAPNITALFEKKLRELAKARATVRGALEAV